MTVPVAGKQAGSLQGWGGRREHTGRNVEGPGGGAGEGETAAGSGGWARGQVNWTHRSVSSSGSLALELQRPCRATQDLLC